MTERTTFRCMKCLGTFEMDPEWSDDDAKKEYEKTYQKPLVQIETMMVCEDCYHLICEEQGIEPGSPIH